MRRRWPSLVVLAAALPILDCVPANVPFEQTYLAANHTWTLRRRFPDADALLNAFDYGHATLYQALSSPLDSATARRLEGREVGFIVDKLLRDPPRVPLDESAIAPSFAKLAPEIVAMFDWAHMLHRQLYDVWSAPNLTDAQREHDSRRAIEYYRSRRDLAFSVVPKSMSLMEGQPYSLVFRARLPKYNGLLWAYHWYQLALQDALIGARDDAARRAGVDSVKTRFFAMVADAPAHTPSMMPMAPMAAPLLSARLPDAAIIFDNLHALHDVVSDILLSPAIPRAEKRAALLRAASAYRDDVTSAITIQDWRSMSSHAR